MLPDITIQTSTNALSTENKTLFRAAKIEVPTRLLPSIKKFSESRRVVKNLRLTGLQCLEAKTEILLILMK